MYVCGCQVSDESTSCEGLGRVAAMLDDVVYRDQQVPLSRDATLLRTLLPGNCYHPIVEHGRLSQKALMMIMCNLKLINFTKIKYYYIKCELTTAENKYDDDADYLNILPFLSRVSILTRDNDIAILSDCPSVCPSVTFQYSTETA